MNDAAIVTTSAAWGPALVAVALVSLLSLVGSLTLVLRRELLQRLVPHLVALAVGAMLGSAFLHLLPELGEDGFGLTLGTKILVGVLLFFGLERFLHAHDHGHDHHGSEGVAPFVWLNLAGDGLHNFADGMIVATAWSAGPGVGLTTTIAVMLHEVPQELGDIGILLHGGLAPRRAVLLNLLTACLALVGAVVALALGSRITGFGETVMALTTGGFIYVALADLIPELHHGRRRGQWLVQIALLVGGAALMGLLARAH